MRQTGRVEVLTGSDYVGDRTVVSRISGQRWEVPEACRIVNAHYLAPSIPAESSPPFAVADDARVVTVNDVVRMEEAPSQYVVVGSGKTATDACVWLLGQGVDPGAICWVRPREPWMLNRALIQPDPEVYLGVPATMFEAAVGVRVARRGVPPARGGRGDDAHRPVGHADDGEVADPRRRGSSSCCARSRTSYATGTCGRCRAVGSSFADGASVRVADDAVVVHCAADGLKNPPLVPIWRPEDITIQPVRAGFPCFGAALTGYVEATRRDDDEKNRLCPPSRFGNSLAQWAEMNVRGTRAAMAFGAEPDIAAWANRRRGQPVPDPARPPRLAGPRRRPRAAGGLDGPGLAALERLMVSG